jgi:hypothetical protein
MAESTRTFLTPDRLKSGVEGDAVVISAAPPRSSRQGGPDDKVFPPTHAANHGITDGTVLPRRRRRVWLMAALR